jgi:protein-S-isoprenylcysteine O-methyltransferase Ste14
MGEAAMRLRSRLHRRGTKSNAWSQVVTVAAIVGGLLGGLAGASWTKAAISTGRWAVFSVGLVFMAFGIYVRQWAIVALGRFFTADLRIQVDQTVIDRGPYRWVRHPSYSGLIVFFVGFGLALTNWLSLLISAVVPTVGLVLRVFAEERSLLAGLGEPYRRYAGTRKRLFPKVW